MWGFFHKHGHAKKHNRRKIYTHNIAAAIVDEFEEVLDEYDITVPDESREETTTRRGYTVMYTTSCSPT